MIIEVIIGSLVANNANFGAWGVLVNVGFSAVDAILDLLDYYLHKNWFNITNTPNDRAQVSRRDYDIRTARRVRGEQRQLDFVITNNGASAGSVVWTMSSRCLLKGS